MVDSRERAQMNRIGETLGVTACDRRVDVVLQDVAEASPDGRGCRLHAELRLPPERRGRGFGSPVGDLRRGRSRVEVLDPYIFLCDTGLTRRHHTSNRRAGLVGRGHRGRREPPRCCRLLHGPIRRKPSTPSSSSRPAHRCGRGQAPLAG